MPSRRYVIGMHSAPPLKGCDEATLRTAGEDLMRSALACVVLGLFTGIAAAGDRPLVGPQFRGPGGAGVADGQKPPVEFGPDKNVKWKITVPPGVSSPIVVGDKLV